MEHKLQNVVCQSCDNNFVIEPEDFNFYTKINVPPPTWCPQCRLIRRFSFQNTWNLSWRTCSKCGERGLSVFSSNQEIASYCQPCWWADDWDGTEYALDYDPARPFLEQLKELMDRTPYPMLEASYSTLKNSEYCNALGWSKDCYLMFWADYCESVYYSSILDSVKFSMDCLRAEEVELCYECVNVNKCYRTFFSQDCDTCVDVWFSRNCYSSSNCVGCVNLRGATYCIFNKKYSKEEYEQKLKELKLDTREGIEAVRRKAEDFWASHPRRSYSGNSLNYNVSGDYVFGSKNSQYMYMCKGAEDCKWSQFINIKTAKDCMDYSGWGNNSTRIYESGVVGENCDSVRFSYGCWPDGLNQEYCSWVISGKNNFGCVNLKKKKYCILNKEYSKEEYEKLKRDIIADMKSRPFIDKAGKKYFYGEFFPAEFSRFPYNRTNAMKFFPKTKEQVLKDGGSWDDTVLPFNEADTDPSELPSRIHEVDESILEKIIKCSSCDNGYRIAKGELALLEKMGLPVPQDCPKCREEKRFKRVNPPKFYDRNCDKCGLDIITAFAPDLPDTVYCEKCYQGEFL